MCILRFEACWQYCHSSSGFICFSLFSCNTRRGPRLPSTASFRMFPPAGTPHYCTYVAEDAGAKVCPEPLCSRTWNVYCTSCRTKGYHLEFDWYTWPYWVNDFWYEQGRGLILLRHCKETKCLVLATLLAPRYKGNVLSVDTLSKAKPWMQEENYCVQARKRSQQWW